jgi:outer membrane receptor protein involved in Fe transport
MLRKILLSIVFLCTVSLVIGQEATLAGKVVDDKGVAVDGASVKITLNGVFKGGVVTDFDGLYRITGLNPGKYDVEVSFVGFQQQKTTGVQVFSGKEISLNVTMTEGDALKDVIIIGYKVPLIDIDNTQQGRTITSDDIKKLPTKSISGMVATSAGASVDKGGNVSIKGSRSDQTFYVIDGIRVRGTSQLPVNEIEQLQVITGGIDAKYGDVAGGLISITTRGPSNKFSGGAEIETSKFLDPFGYTFALLNISGPILTKKSKDGTSKESVLGFRLSGQYIDQKDADPTPVKRAYLTDASRAILEKNPVTLLGDSKVSTGEFFTNKDVQFLDYNPNNTKNQLDLTAKLDAKLAKNVDLTLTGTLYKIKDQFTPEDGDGRTWQVFNSQNNPFSYTDRYRGNFRFRHRLTNQNKAAEVNDGATKIKNASYTVQVGYEVGARDRYDTRHKDNLFNYGYVGVYKNENQPAFNPISQGGRTTDFINVGYTDVFTGYTPSNINPILANYNNVSDVTKLGDFNTLNGQIIGSVNNVWDLHQNIGRVYNTNDKTRDNTFTGQVAFNFDIIPGGKLDKAHNIQFGLLYEQRIDRFYSINPNGLWTLAQQQQNRQINGLDLTRVRKLIATPLYLEQGVIDSVETFELLIQNTGEDVQFWRNVRKRYGLSENWFINVNELDPSKMTLDLFTAQELNDQRLLRYYGFDYLGNALPATTTFKEFFATPKNGARTYPVAAFQPLYTAGYIQDKFTFKDIIFNLGLRVDRYDANTSVLKDLYTLYDIEDAKTFYTRVGGYDKKPSNIDDSYKVYVTSKTSDIIQAYRKDDQWFNSRGEPVAAESLFGTKQVFPKYVTLGGTSQITPNYIKEKGYNPDNSFTDYKPQVNWMPRLSFSFPISDFANFFAHYDILVQRPSGNNIATALDYYYFNQLGDNTISNPNLKPEKTIDYELGFQQRMNSTSAIKIAAYYKEIRDNINVRRINYVPEPIFKYPTFDNLDFSTVKGFTFQYDLRRTGNFQAQLNYTLQFADGTGSDARSQLEISKLQNVRSIYPLNFDERHRFAVNLDYRYEDGKKYNGPKLFGKDIFSNTGVNFLISTVSGRPYTAKALPLAFDGGQTVGGINGSRKPWTFTIDARIDKSFNLSKSENHPLNVNVFLRVQNLLNTLNIESVYPATGSATEDGYLQSTQGQSALNQIKDANRSLQSFSDSYQWRLLNPDNFALPRRVFLGATFDF